MPDVTDSQTAQATKLPGDAQAALAEVHRLIEALAAQRAQAPGDSPGGDAAFDRDEDAWIELGKRLKTYQVTAGGLRGRVEERLLRIDHDFKFVATSEDADFMSHHVETHLDQAADLLERAIRDRSEWEEKAAKTALLGLDLQEYYDLDAVHTDEVAKGYYTVPAKVSRSEEQATKLAASATRMSAIYLEAISDRFYTIEKVNEVLSARQCAAWLAHVAAYSLPYQGDLLKNTFNGVAETSPVLNMRAAFAEASHELLSQALHVSSQRYAVQAQAESTGARHGGAAIRADWDARDVDFKRRRTAISRRIADLKLKAFTEPGGALHYPEQMAALKLRFTRDYREAVARMKAAADGLVRIYGYTTPLPMTDGKISFDEALVWVRESIGWLLRFSRLDQGYVLPVSVHNLLKDDKAWRDGVESGNWTFTVPEGLFKDQVHVRLRGLSAFVRTTNVEDPGVWNFSAIVPRDGWWRHVSKTEGRLTQENVPPARIGRVGIRAGSRDPDVVGVAALHNVCPIGQWQLSLGNQSTGGMSRERVTDVQLDLHLAVRAAGKR